MEELHANRSRQADHDSFEHERDAKARERDAKQQKELDDALDQGLEDSFPGSDPVSVTQPPASAYDKNAK